MHFPPNCANRSREEFPFELGVNSHFRHASGMLYSSQCPAGNIVARFLDDLLSLLEGE